MRRSFRFLAAAAVTLCVIQPWLAAAASFTTFESGQVRPLALSPDGSRLFAVNTPDDRLEIFTVGGGLVHVGSVPVGMEPVAVAARTNTEVWVVNHLSDSISVVDVGGAVPRVVRTLLVGDEPRDIVFAGAGGGRAFITTAHRGQHRIDPSLAGVPGAGDPQFTTPGVGRADVWVFDAANPGAALGGTPVGIVTLFGDTPRALAVSPSGGTVYAAVFKSGNRTTTIAEGAVCDGFASAGSCTTSQGFVMPGGLPGPGTNSAGARAPETGLIVKFDGASGQWRDPLARNWSPAVRFSLPDYDVFAIDAATLGQTAAFSGVGTVLFNLAVNPVSGDVYVSNTEARNEIRFEGPGIFGGSTVQGHLAEARVTVLSGAAVVPRHLNPHIDYSIRPAPAGVKDASLSMPVGMAVSPDGATLYVAAFGSSRIGVLDTAALAAGTFDPLVASADYLVVSGGGPSGVVLDAPRNRLYALTRFDNAVSVIDLGTRSETGHHALHNPEPPSVVAGRPFLYDAVTTSSNGEASCASCHVFGDMDDLAWDLGNPDAAVKTNPIPINLGIAVSSGVIVLPTPINGTGRVNDFHPMKGPMTTQTLRGLDGSGAMHWRGDRANPPGTAASAFNEVISFNNFNEAFPGLLGRDAQLAPADMQKFTDFALQITLPPNPVRRLDNSLTPAQQAGFTFFFGPRRSDGLQNDIGSLQLGFTCEGCHTLNPANLSFGTAGRASFENEVQIAKIPHLRNLYQKIGMFGVVDIPIADPANQPFQGDQIRGFGFLHDGSVDTLFDFFHGRVFANNSFGGPNVGFQNDQQRRDVEQFMLAFDTNLAPIVGQQITRTSTNAAVVDARIDLLVQRAAAGECDVVVKGVLGGLARGWYRRTDGLFVADRAAEAPVAEVALRGQAATAGNERTYTCVPRGAGERSGVDRDLDGYFDRDEVDAGTDPADADSFPGSTPAPIPASSLVLKETATRKSVTFVASTKGAAVHIVPPGRGTAGDPTLGGATVVVHNAAGLAPDVVSAVLPASGWTALGSAANPKGYRYTGLGAINRVTLTPDQIKIKGGKSGWTYTLDEPAQGRIAVRLAPGTEQGWCADVAAKAGGQPPSTARYDRPGKFVGERGAPAPAACAPLGP
jgi:DNA-binding beta-propeller fold protein YncE